MLEYDPMRRDYDTRISLRSYRLNYTGRYEPMRGFEPLFLACYLTLSRGRRLITSDYDFRVISPLIIFKHTDRGIEPLGRCTHYRMTVCLNMICPMTPGIEP